MYDSITVPAEWLAKAKQYGTQRDLQNGGNDTPAYAHNKPLPYSSLTASRLAVVAEVAACLYFGVDPESITFVVDRSAANYASLRASADLTVNGHLVEVRNSTRQGSPLPIKSKDAKAGAYVVQAHVVMEPTETGGKRPTGEVVFLGWQPGSGYRPEQAYRGTDYRHTKLPMSDLTAVLA